VPVPGQNNTNNLAQQQQHQQQQQRMQQNMQPGLQAQLQLAQVANNARAQLQANYHSQMQIGNAPGTGLPTNMQGLPGNIGPGPPASIPAGLPHPGQLPLAPPVFPPQPINITPTEIRSLIIPDTMTETAYVPPKPARFLDYVRPSRLSLSNGLGANHSMAMPVYSARPPILEELAAMFKTKSGRGHALKGTLFDKSSSLDGDEDRDEPKNSERVLVEEEDVNMSEPEKRSPGQVSVDEVEEETTIHPRVKRRKLCDVAKLAKRDLTISEGSEEVGRVNFRLDLIRELTFLTNIVSVATM